MTAATTTNSALQRWVRTVAEHTRPARVHWWSGTRAERAAVTAAMVQTGELIPLAAATYPRSFLHRTGLEEASVDESASFVATHKRIDAGPTNDWMSRDDALTTVWPLFAEVMQGRTMYVVPYMLGAPRSPFCRVGVEITDSPYVALCLDAMTRAGRVALEQLGGSLNFGRGLHSVGRLPSRRRRVVHFPDTVETWSIGSSSLKAALFCAGRQGLRLASAQARDEGWLAEHMSLWALTKPGGEKLHFALAMADGCARAELAPGESSLAGWSLEKLGADSAWMRAERDGHLWAQCPESGVWANLGGTPRRSPDVRPLVAGDALFTNVALRGDGRVWWEGCPALDPHEIVEDWRGAAWTERGGFGSAAHPEAHVVAPFRAAGAAKTVGSAQGVPIAAIIFCGRQSRSSPLVYEARSLRHGVYVGATLVDEVAGPELPRHDPMGMLGYCGYNMGDYLSHWLEIGRKLHYPPKFFHLNCFRSDAAGKRLWPGGAENIRILKWIAERVEGTAAARVAPVGLVPEPDALDLEGLDVTQDCLLQLLSGNHGALLRQAERARAFLVQLGDTLPPALLMEHRHLVRTLQESLH